MKQDEIIQLANELLKKHSLEFIKIELSPLYSSYGKYVEEINFTGLRVPKKIILCSENLKRESKRRVRLVILHEIAHAMVGTSHGHDEVWKKKCLEIGGDGKTKTGPSLMPLVYILTALAIAGIIASFVNPALISLTIIGGGFALYLFLGERNWIVNLDEE